MDTFVWNWAGVHRVRGRGEHQIDAPFATARQVVFEISRVAIKILFRSELQRIDEDGHRDEVGADLGSLDEREVPVVERAHRWHEPDAAGVGARIIASPPKFGRLADHGGHPRGP